MDATNGAGTRTTGVQVIARAADVLRSLQGHPHGLSLSEIAARVGLARSTVHRLVAALEDEGFVVPASPNGRVRLGPMLARLAAASRGDLRDELHPSLQRLAAEVGETVDLAVLDGANVRFLDQLPAPHRRSSDLHRLVAALEDEGFVVPASPNGRVRLGPMLARLAAASRGDLRDELHPSLQRLAAEVGETVDLAVLEGANVRFLDQIPAPHR